MLDGSWEGEKSRHVRPEPSVELKLTEIMPSLAPAVPGRTPRSREDLDADLQRAIELSLADSQPAVNRFVGSEPPLARKAGTVEDDDEEMRLAIEASLRDIEKARPSAPQGAEEPEFKVAWLIILPGIADICLAIAHI